MQDQRKKFGYSFGFDIDSAAGKALVEKAIELLKTRPPSLAMLQRELNPGYAITSSIMAELERRGIVSEVLPGGERRYFGEGAEAREAFKAFAEELRIGLEPAAHWWRNLNQTARGKYLPGAAPGAMWGDLSKADQSKLRLRFYKNLDALRALEVQFSFMPGRGVLA